MINEILLRNKTEKRLCRKITDSQWRWLKKEGWVSEALGADDPVGVLVSGLSSMYEAHLAQTGHSRPTGRKETRQVQNMVLRDIEMDRARSAAESLAATLTCQIAEAGDMLGEDNALGRAVTQQLPPAHAIGEFRAHFLGGKTLTPQAAQEFLISPATRFLTPQQFHEHDIPFVGHHATLIGDDGEPLGANAYDLSLRLLIQASRNIKLRFEPSGRVVSTKPVSEELAWLAVPDAEERIGALPLCEVPYCYDALLGTLCWIAHNVATATGLTEAQVAWFALTGHIVPEHPLRAQVQMAHGREATYAGYRITLSIEPWVAAETVQRAYRDIQQRMLGGDCEELSPRKIGMVRFVSEKIKTLGNRPSWGVLHAAMRQLPAESRYFDPSNLRRAYQDAESRWVFPKYNPPFRVANDSHRDSQEGR